MPSVIGLLLLSAAGIVPTGPAWAGVQETTDFRVVVHESNPLDALSIEDLSDLFLKRRSEWEAGGAVLPVDRTADAAVRESFSRAAFKRSTRAMVAYWQQQIFSGRGVPPTQVASDSEVLEYVRTHPGAVGYVSGDVDVHGVKVVEVVR